MGEANSPTDYIAIITDMHLEPLDGRNPQRRGIVTSPEVRTRNLETVYQDLASGESPEAVLFGGDNANQSVSRPDYRRYAHSFMKRFPAPVYALPGNHDVGSTAGWPHHDPDAMSEACLAFRQDWDDWWLLEAAGFRILGINTQIFGSVLPEAEAQCRWLREHLSRPRQEHLLTVVFGHTPPFLKSADDNFRDGSEQMCLQPEARRPLLDVLFSSPPDLLITAHAHRHWIRQLPDWTWMGLPTTAVGQKDMPTVPSHNLPEGDDHVGWIALSRDGGGWRVRFHRLDA